MNKTKVKVSVIMSEYNTPPAHLREAINSILNQTFTDFEFIIIDDCSTNDLLAIAKAYDDKRIRIIRNNKNKGLAHSLNSAIHYAEGKYLVRMDTDDIAQPDRIGKLYEFIDSHNEYTVVGSRAIEFSEAGDNGILGLAGEKTKHSILRSDAMIHPSVIMKKSAVEAVGGYPDYNRAEDFALWCELLLAKNKFYVIDEVLLKYRVNTDDYKKRVLRRRRGEIKAKIHYYQRLNAKPTDYLHIARSIVAGILPASVVIAYHKRAILKAKPRDDK